MNVRRNAYVACCVVLLAIGAVGLPGCTPPDVVVFSILGKTYELSFSDVGGIELRATETVYVPTAVRLFRETPVEEPPTGQMTLPSTSVGVARRLTAKTAARAQTLPLGGSATIRFKVAAGQSAELCDNAVLLAEYDLTLITGIAAIADEVYDLSREAMAAMMANDVTICIEVESDFDGEITIGEYFFAFGGGDAGVTPPSAITVPPLLDGSLLQVPIDNAGGTAVAVAPNKTIDGVSYGVFGVLEAQTAAVTTVTVETSSVTVAPADLGLLTVEKLYIATHSSFIPDMFNGVTVATLTVSYASGSPTTLDFVAGSTTAEWSYDRLEHAAAYGAVPHTQPSVLYDFETMIDSASVYTGSVYSGVLTVDDTRTISSISLAMADPTSYATGRIETGSIATMAGQALSAITLVGEPLVVATQEACCLADGACVDLEPEVCSTAGGTPRGDGSECASTECDGGTDPVDGPTVCCVAGVETLSRAYTQVCVDWDRQECIDGDGVPQASGETCDTVVCDEPFVACCDPASDACVDILFDTCVDRDWDPKAFGVHCDDAKCPSDRQACCFSSGFCQDLDTTTCTDSGGTPDVNGDLCAAVDCKGACCKSDGNCERMTSDACDDDPGEFAGLDVDCADAGCSTVGGCCFNDSLSCLDMDAASCTAQGGQPQTTCGPDQCIFACCLTDGTCDTLKTVDECTAASGTVSARGTDCHSVTCTPAGPTKWVLSETQVNPDGFDSDNSWVGFFDEEETTYTTSANSVIYTDRYVDNSVEQYNITITSTFPTPAAELNPGDTVVLSVTFTHGGTHLAYNPLAQFQYWVNGHAIDPPNSYYYAPWGPAFTGESSTTYSFGVPSVTTDGTLTVTAFWWNCSECDVSWVYRPG